MCCSRRPQLAAPAIMSGQGRSPHFGQIVLAANVMTSSHGAPDSEFTQQIGVAYHPTRMCTVCSALACFGRRPMTPESPPSKFLPKTLAVTRA